jgi:iron-sulfur cluster repair protein YtfE (RIC family)
MINPDIQSIKNSLQKRLPKADNDSLSLASDLEYTYLDPVKAEASAFVKYDISLLVKYLEECHRDYSDLLIPNILNSFSQLLKNAPECKLLQQMGPVIIYGFKKDALAHFEYEEWNLFPYARAIEKGEQLKSYSTQEFERNHPEHVVDIDRLIKFFELLAPELESHMTYRILMKRLRDLKLEFEVHGLIEDRVLIPKLKSLE